MRFQIARAAAHTGEMLRTLVETEMRETGVTAPADAVVCYGAGLDARRPHTLNALCSRFNKLQQAVRLQERLGVNSLGVIQPPQGGTLVPGTAGVPTLPWLARKTAHTKGKDIMAVLEPWQIPARLSSGASYFTPYVPSITEYRSWVYRNRVLGTYEKRMTRPQDCTRLGRNYANGFDFSFREGESVPEALKDVVRRAIAALGLDFGMVDTLETPDHNFVVLEVNSAGGVQNDRRNVIRALAHRIVRWAANGCPERQQDGGAE